MDMSVVLSRGRVMTRGTAAMFALGVLMSAPTEHVHGQASPPAAAAVETRATPFDTTTPDRSVARRFAGCFDVDVGRWVERPPFNYQNPTPTRMVLDTTIASARGPSLAARTPSFRLPRDLPQWSDWSPVGNDSLQVTAWADGHTSVHFFMRAESADHFVGVARYFTDVVFVDEKKRWLWEQYPTAPVRMTRAMCTP